MRRLRIVLMVVFCVLWAGAVRADDKGNKGVYTPVPQAKKPPPPFELVEMGQAITPL